MLRDRLITVLTLNDGVLFRTRNFVPDYRYTLSFVDLWSIDEMVVLDITRPGEGHRDHFLAAVNELASKCFVPLAAGGGVRSLEDFKILLRNGADKVIVNTEAVHRPELITEGAEAFGAQCVVVSIDAKRNAAGEYEVYTHHGTRATGLEPAAWAREAQRRGAGEIMITSIERDGMLEGYDLELTKRVADAVDVPVLACGGAGAWGHFVDAIRKGHASAACTTNIYHFTEPSIKSAKAFMRRAELPVRI